MESAPNLKLHAMHLNFTQQVLSFDSRNIDVKRNY